MKVRNLYSFAAALFFTTSAAHAGQIFCKSCIPQTSLPRPVTPSSLVPSPAPSFSNSQLTILPPSPPATPTPPLPPKTVLFNLPPQ